jgi:exodeoxyribonuclease V gamma subunit
VAPHTRLLLKDETLAFTTPDAPDALLHGLLQIYRAGLQAPIHFFPKSAWAFSEAGRIAKAEETWRVTTYKPHAEGADAWHRLAMRGVAEPLDGAFEALALAVFGPLREHLVAEA